MIFLYNLPYLFNLIGFGFVPLRLYDSFRDIITFINKMIAFYPAFKTQIFKNILYIPEFYV